MDRSDLRSDHGDAASLDSIDDAWLLVENGENQSYTVQRDEDQHQSSFDRKSDDSWVLDGSGEDEGIATDCPDSNIEDEASEDESEDSDEVEISANDCTGGNIKGEAGEDESNATDSQDSGIEAAGEDKRKTIFRRAMDLPDTGDQVPALEPAVPFEVENFSSAPFISTHPTASPFRDVFELSQTGTLNYEAPVTKPLPPGLSVDTDIEASGSICNFLPHEDYLQDVGDERLCQLCLGQLCQIDELPVSLRACGHCFHMSCIREIMNDTFHKCPECRIDLLPAEDRLRYIRGDMPSGSMSWDRCSSLSCGGYEAYGCIVITYRFDSPRQQFLLSGPSPSNHQPASWTAYLPDNEQGQVLFYRLSAAFLCGLTFKVGTSFNNITWASIPHKTYPQGGIANIGYPDENYLSNCNAELDTIGLPSHWICKQFFYSLNQGERNHGDFYYNYHECTKPEDVQACDLSSLWAKITSQEFLAFIENSLCLSQVIQINENYHVLGTDMLQAFLEEWKACSSSSDNYDVRIVFHGTNSPSVESVLCNGLDLSKESGLHHQGKYFASRPELSLRYCCGGNRLLLFAVIASALDTHNEDIIIVNKPGRYLPIATLSFDNNVNIKSSAWRMADSFQVQVTKLRNEDAEKAKLLEETRTKERIIHLVLEGEYLSASDIYKRACDVDGMPPQSWAREVAMYVRNHIRDEEEIGIYFPKLPPRIFLSRYD